MSEEQPGEQPTEQSTADSQQPTARKKRGWWVLSGVALAAVAVGIAIGVMVSSGNSEEIQTVALNTAA